MMTIFSFSVTLADTQTDNLIQLVDQTYAKLLSSAPKNIRLRKSQQRYWSKVEMNLNKALQQHDGDNFLAYQIISIKIQQRSSTFKFSTTDLITQFGVVNETNRIRKENGKSLLQYNLLLSLAAYAHANDMYQNFPNKDGEILSHTSSNGDTLKERAERVGYTWSHIAENIARNQDTIGQVMKDWMNSTGHRENILSDTIVEIGVAKVGPYWVQDFGTQMVNK